MGSGVAAAWSRRFRSSSSIWAARSALKSTPGSIASSFAVASVLLMAWPKAYDASANGTATNMFSSRAGKFAKVVSPSRRSSLASEIHIVPRYAFHPCVTSVPPGLLLEKLGISGSSSRVEKNCPIVSTNSA